MFLTIKLCTHAKLNCFNRTDYYIKMDLALNNQQRSIYHKTQQTKPNQTKKLKIESEKKKIHPKTISSVGLDCRMNIPIASLQRGKTTPTSIQDMTRNNLMVRFSNTGALGNAEYPSIAISPRSTQAWSGSNWYGPIYESNRTNLCTYV